MSDYACLVLPFPPTTNNLFAGKTRRFKSRRYKEWSDEAGRAIAAQNPPGFACPVAVTYSYGRPDKRRRDIGNLEKAVSDSLVDTGVLADDSLIEKLTLQWCEDVTGCRVEIEALTLPDKARRAGAI